MEQNDLVNTPITTDEPPSLGWKSAWKVTKEVYIWVIGFNILSAVFRAVFGGPDILLLLFSVVLPIVGIIAGIRKVLPQTQQRFPIFRTAFLIGVIPLAALFLFQLWLVTININLLQTNGLTGVVVLVGQISSYSFTAFAAAFVYSITTVISIKRRINSDISLKSIILRLLGLIFLLFFIYIFIQGIFVIFILTTAGTGFMENQSKNEVVVETSKTADWKTYRNEKFGFEVRYPQTLELEESGRPEDVMNFKNKGLDENISFISVGAWLTIKGSISFDEFIENYEVGERNHRDGERPVQVSEIFNIDGKRAITIKPINTSVIETIIEYDDVYSLSLYIYGQSKIEEEILKNDYSGYNYLEEISDKMLSTFKFIYNENDTSNWKTYSSEKFGFEVKYLVGTNVFEVPAGFDDIISGIDFSGIIEGYTIRVTPTKNSRHDTTLTELFETRDGIEVASGDGFSDIQLKNLKAVKRINTIPDGTRIGATVIILGEDYFYAIGTGNQHTPGFDANEEKLFDAFVATFRFID